MKKTILLFLFAGILFAANSQQMEFSWITQAGGPGWDIVTDIAELPDGQIVMTGSFYDKISFGGDTLVSNGERDIFIARYSADGTLNKVISLGGSGYDYVKKIVITGRSGIILPIQFDRELRLGEKEFKGKYLNNVVVSCFDKNLEPTNNFMAGSNGEFGITSLKMSPDSGFYFSGWFNDTLTIDNKMYVSKGGSDIFMGKASGKGKPEWIKHFEGEGNDRQNAFWVDEHDMNYVTGTTTAGCFGSEKKPKPARLDKEGNYLFLSQVDDSGNTGNVLYPVSGISVEPAGLLKDSTFLWLLANFEYSAFIGGAEVVSYGKNDVLLIKYNLTDHSANWCQLGGFGNEKANGLVKSGDGIMITGQYADSIVFAGKTIVSDRRGPDVFIAAVDNNCKPKNIVSFRGVGMDFPCSVLASGSGIFLAGEFNDTLVAGETILASAGEEDIFLARIENCSAKNPLKITMEMADHAGKNQSWELDAGEGFTTYSWDDSTSLGRYYIVEAPGTFKVEVTDSLGCFYSGEITLDGTKSAQMEEDEPGLQERPFKIYPTITSGMVYWEPASAWIKNKATVRVYDPSGKVNQITEIQELTTAVYRVNFAAKAEGAWFVEVSGDGFREISKVIVKR